ncbi:hypothetical protein NSB25_24875 [Acetatifactor muris]|jgi:hypothetical protein|uniref:Uncharacterized protein n=1 Tax=Acetatifactor muris TaxID=879566 RepID=A0A2K4ZQE8_9FIRM|nr:hypothetical protein [Acetatifactor muris]MCR2050473.1 hypothetical protein [Acetatifactor muris]NBI92517.1 hypothetical protein [Lachnospiraceae bacterium]SOY32699.1 hypothetical protein AMURIS_05465 [Acetatifactor muris]
MKRGKLLDRIASQRMGRDIDRVLRKDREYRDAVKQQDIAFDELKKLGLDKAQRLTIDRAISADNQCGAVYGAVAYRLGMKDGIRLMTEIRQIAHQQ